MKKLNAQNMTWIDTDELAQRDAEIAELRKDAERYRFMRASATLSDGRKSNSPTHLAMDPEFFDATIDLAIAAADEKGGAA